MAPTVGDSDKETATWETIPSFRAMYTKVTSNPLGGILPLPAPPWCVEGKRLFFKKAKCTEYFCVRTLHRQHVCLSIHRCNESNMENHPCVEVV